MFYRIMPTANELGFLEQGSDPANKLTAGLKLELNGAPEYKEDKDGNTYVLIPTTKGKFYSFGAAVIGSLRSTNAKSIGGLLTQALEIKKTLTVWSTEHESNNKSGRMVLGLSAFPPRK